MNTLEQYKKILQDLNSIQLRNKSFIDQLYSSSQIRAALGFESYIDNFLKDRDKMQEIYSTLPAIQNFLNSAAFEKARQATIDISKFTDTIYIQEMTKQFSNLSDLWNNQIKVLGFNTDSMKEAQLGLQSHFTRLSEMSILAEQTLANIDWKMLGINLGFTKDVRELLCSNVTEFSGTYSALVKSFHQPNFNILSFPPVVTSIPPIEFYNDTSLFESLSVEDTESFEEKDTLNSEIVEDTEKSVEWLLSKLDPKLLTIWVGAKQALRSNNADRIRHFAASLRELHTHIMHKLAPDDDIRNWSDLPEHYDEKGNPKRRARLLYICREINHEPFTLFVKKDIDAILSLIELLQIGTHDIEARFSDTQLSLIKIRAEGSLRFLLEIAIKTGGA